MLVCVWTAQALGPEGQAGDDTPKKDALKKDTKAEEKDKDKKTESVKKAQVSGAEKKRGIIDKLASDGKSMTLEIRVGRTTGKLEVLIAEDATVRVPRELQFDEKGKPKPFKKDGLPGMPGSMDDLHERQVVDVTLGKLPNKKLVATFIVVYGELKTGKK
jgi:hypothetical protein